MPLTLSGTNGVSGIDGSASTPSVRGSTSANNGVFYGTNTVSISTNNGERMRVASDGTVNIVGAGTAGSTQAVSFNGGAPAGAMVMDSSGNVGIGTTSPSSYGKFTINDTSYGSLYIRSSSTNFSGFALDNTNSATKWQFGIEGGLYNAAGSLNIGISGVGPAIFVSTSRVISFNAYGAGTLTTNSSGVISASDGRYKDKTRDVSDGLQTILRLKPTYYRWHEDTPFHTEHEELGFIAQEVADVIPEASPNPEEPDKYKNYSDRAIIAMMTKAIQELSAKLDAAEARIAALEAN